MIGVDNPQRGLAGKFDLEGTPVSMIVEDGERKARDPPRS
jgi:hypothetical protein